MDSVTSTDIGILEHIQPSHAVEIARPSPRESWPEWVESCEKNKWTVAELRKTLSSV